MALELIRDGTDDLLDEATAADYYVLGGEHVGASIARQVRAAGASVVLVDESHDAPDVPVHEGDPGDVRVLAEAGVGDATAVVVATPTDSRNLLIAQLVRAHFDIEEALMLVHSPDRYDVVAEVGHRPVCATSALSEAVVSNLDTAVVDRST
jgi:trk system potassium uptake protein TrkA